MPEDDLRTHCGSLVEDLLPVLLDPTSMSLDHEAAAGGGGRVSPVEVLAHAWGEAIRLVALAHRDCGLDPDISWRDKCQMPYAAEDELLGGEWMREMRVYVDDTSSGDRRWRIEPSSPLADNREVFLDTLCIYLQTYPTRDLSLWHRAPEGTPDFDGAVRRQRLVDSLRPVLEKHDLHVTDAGEVMFREFSGTRAVVEGPTLDALDGVGWTDVADKLREAEGEIRADRFGDAITDSAVALEVALRRAGHEGNTLGERLKSARRSGGFAGADTKLGSGLEELVAWMTAVRNTKSDAHDAASSDQAEAVLALRLSATVAAWLGGRASTPDSQDLSA
ncbi:abortive infection family protein [Knoellia subterranea]|uniref:abortive infection family protein n=1 Tax=Knoellia subterranea TaxID=184882 RepID=UPI0012EB30AC|nr:hypothetical protein [Knoellia subterranea]